MFNYTNSNEETIIEEIEHAKKYYEEQIEFVNKQETIKDLLYKNYIAKVKRNISKYDYSYGFIEEASKELSNEKSKKKESLNWLTSTIRSDFLNDSEDFKIVAIMKCGFETYAWQIYLQNGDVIISIKIPVLKNLTIENFDAACNGKFSFFVKKQEYVSSLIESSYSMKDIADSIKEYFEKQKSK